MPKLTLTIAAAVLTLAGAANAQQQPAAPQPSPAAQAARPTIHSISIVDIKALPKEVQAKVNDVVAKRSDADLQKLRSSIDAAAHVKSALEAKGLTSKEVIAASLGKDGALTLITKTPG